LLIFQIAGTPAFSIQNYYNKTVSTTADFSKPYSVETTYTEGCWKGKLFYDFVSIPTAQIVVPVHMPVTEITSAKNFFINDSDWQVSCIYVWVYTCQHFLR